MEVINFPSSAPKKAKQPKAACVEDLKRHLYTGPWHFTCSKCDHVLEFSSEGMIFRKVSFYCEKCGTLHEVTNPAFTTPNTGRK